jgi:hypothetical protein
MAQLILVRGGACGGMEEEEEEEEERGGHCASIEISHVQDVSGHGFSHRTGLKKKQAPLIQMVL